MLCSVAVTFLGTSSAQPSSTRNHSCLALRMDSDLWLFDCGEATQIQMQRSTLKMGRIKKIFITHTHGDHIFGILPLLAGMLNGHGGTVDAEDPRLRDPANAPPVEIYGPIGTRLYIRAGLKSTHTNLGGRYVVHEIKFPHDPDVGEEGFLKPHHREMHGRDIRPTLSEAGKTQWLDLFQDEHVVVHAAPIRHSVACVGYVVCEKPIPGKIDLSLYAPHLERNRAALAALGVRQPNMKLRELQKGNDVHLPDGTVLRPPIPRPGFKMAILGDTCDSSGIADLAQSCDLLIHEATNAHLPGVDPETKEEDTEQTVEARTRSHGHSTPQMAGMFASTVQAKRLILNHFSARYAGDDDTNEESAKIMNGIADLARRHYNGEVTCARDFMTVEVQRPKAG